MSGMAGRRVIRPTNLAPALGVSSSEPRLFRNGMRPAKAFSPNSPSTAGSSDTAMSTAMSTVNAAA